MRRNRTNRGPAKVQRTDRKGRIEKTERTMGMLFD